MDEHWAYDFTCDRPIDAILAAFNEAGPWQWELRENTIYGSYLNTRPQTGVRAQIHEYPFTGPYGAFTGLHARGFNALLEVRTGSGAARSEIDGVVRTLLGMVGATNVAEIEPY